MVLAPSNAAWSSSSTDLSRYGSNYRFVAAANNNANTYVSFNPVLPEFGTCLRDVFTNSTFFLPCRIKLIFMESFR